MAITFKTYGPYDGLIRILDDTEYKLDENQGLKGLLLNEHEAVQVRDELLRRYPLEKAEAPKPAESAPLVEIEEVEKLKFALAQERFTNDQLIKQAAAQKDAKPAEPAPLSLKVGKWYRRRDGQETVLILKIGPCDEFGRRFVGNNGCRYHGNGGFSAVVEASIYDLIAEVPAPGEADEASKQGSHEPASPVGVLQHVHTRRESDESAGAKAAAAAVTEKPAWTPPTLEESYASLQRAYEKTDAAFARKCEEHSAEREKRFELEARLNESLASHAKLEAKIHNLNKALKALIGE